MYLTDKQLRARLSELRFESEHSDYPFDPDEQVGPCSVDLRLSSVHWRTRRWHRPRRPIDLGKSRLMELDPRRHWERRQLQPGESLALKPGEMILGRTAERIEVPADCAARIEGRSSFARMGLTVHATGSFINPGWRGRMPLTLVNHGPAELRIPIFTAVCQLMVLPLAEPPARSYAARRGAKYQDDDGGPSYWWRDQAFQKIRDAAGPELGARVLDELDELVVKWEVEVLERLEDFLHRTRQGSFSNASDLLDAFSVRERRSRLRDRLLITSCRGSLALAFAALGIAGAVDWHAAALWALALVTVLTGTLSIWGFNRDYGTFLTRELLQDLRVERDRRRPG